MNPQNPQPQRPKRNTGCVIAAVIGVAVVLLIGAVSCGALLSTASDPGPMPGQHRAKAATSAPSGTATPEDTPTASKPRKGDFELRVKTLSKDCFGSAGCNVTYRIKVAYTGPSLDPDATYEVTYKVTGADDGATENTFTITGDQAEVQQEEMASTSSSGIELRAHATSVERLS